MEQQKILGLMQSCVLNQCKSSHMADCARQWLMVALHWPDKEAAKQAEFYAKNYQQLSHFFSETSFSVLSTLLQEL